MYSSSFCQFLGQTTCLFKFKLQLDIIFKLFSYSSQFVLLKINITESFKKISCLFQVGHIDLSVKMDLDIHLEVLIWKFWFHIAAHTGYFESILFLIFGSQILQMIIEIKCRVMVEVCKICNNFLSGWLFHWFLTDSLECR